VRASGTDAASGQQTRTHDRMVLLVALGVMAVTTAVAVLAASLLRQVNSDDLAWQRLLDIWGTHGHTKGWISEDLFLSRYPLYLVLDAVGIVGRRSVTAASVVTNVAAGAAFAVGLVISGELARPLRWRLVAALAVLSLWTTAAWDLVFFSPNTRTFELALTVLAIAWLGIVAARPTLRLGALAGATALATFVWLSDPFALYAIGVPAALVAVADLFVVRRRRTAVTVLAVLAVSALAAQVARWILELFDVFLRGVAGGERHLTDVSDVFDRARLVLERYAALLGVSGSDLTSGPVGSTALAWLRLGLVALGVAGAVITVRRWSSASLLARTLVVCIVSSPIAVTLVNVYSDSDILIDRYLGAGMIGLAGLAVIAVDRLSGRVGRAAVVVMAALVVGVFASNVVSTIEDRDASPDADAVALAEGARAALWDRVYGYYWLALRTDQIDQAGPEWIHVECDDTGRLKLMPWHNDTSVLRSPNQGDTPETIAVALEGLPCTLADLERTYGPAARETTIDGHRFAVWETADASPRLRSLT
jgi:MFS family permease